MIDVSIIYIYIFFNYSVAYKLVPDVIEFYEAVGQKIGDRLLFTKDGISWQPKHIAA